MGNWVSSSSSKKKKGPTITDTDRAILSLKTQRRKLEDQEKLLSERIDRHAEVARLLLKEGKKDRALLALRRKKLIEHQRTQLGGLLTNTEAMLNNIEASKQQAALFNVLKQGNEALKQLQAQVKLEDVKLLMEETQQAAEYQAELRSMLEGSAAQLSEEESLQVDEELSALEELVAAEEKEALPSVPKTKVPTKVAAADTAQQAAAAAEEEEAEVEEEQAQGRTALLAS